MQTQTKPSNLKTNSLSRREFLRRTSLAAATAALTFPYVGRVLGANDRINLACIGVGGKGDSDSRHVAMCGGNVVAICDVDLNNLHRKSQQSVTVNGENVQAFARAKRYQDYRKLYDEMGKDIDAVTVSIPDHNHGQAAKHALLLSKAVYCQKPLTQTVYEARTLRRLAAEKHVATQMGNQGSAEDGLRRAVEIVQAGVIGNPLEVHVWTNRPVWPQAIDRPKGSDPVPAYLNWDCWLGPAHKRPFKKDVYHPFKWRGWYDFGTGALGDMACHTVNMPFRACKMGYPNVVECEIDSRTYPETFPKTSRIRWEFPEREGLPPLKFWWYDGNPGDPLQPLRPGVDKVVEIVNTMGTLPHSGALIIAEKGKLFSPDDYGARFFIAMKGEDKMTDGPKHEACRNVPITIPRNEGVSDNDQRQKAEWFRMIRGGAPAYSNFDIAAYLSEIILLGAIGLRVGEGYRMDWDGPNMRSTNLPSAARFVRRHNRHGWNV